MNCRGRYDWYTYWLEAGIGSCYVAQLVYKSYVGFGLVM